jgi:NAD(P)-dependent dehydrogenase (short-subunit alcohol dehydrogenase family)
MPTSRVVLEQSTVLVTGAGSGIGRATALAMAGAGARVLAADIDGVSAKETAGICGDGARDYYVDVSDSAAVDELAAQIEGEGLAVDLLVNNAGVGISGPFLDTTLEDWEWVIGINLMGIIHACRAFVPAMIGRGRGHVVNIASGLGYVPTAGEPAYCATKAAVISISGSTRADWHRSGVGVSVICPGVINTPIISRTRFRGSAASESSRSRIDGIFRHGHSPGSVADAVVSAVERNRAFVPVGAEAHLGRLLRHLPAAGGDALNRLSTEVRRRG